MLLPSFKNHLFIHLQFPTLVSEGCHRVCLCLNYPLCQQVEVTDVIVPCCAFRLICNAVYHSSLVCSCTRFHLLVLFSLLLPLQLFQSLRSDSHKLLFDLPSLIHSPICLALIQFHLIPLLSPRTASALSQYTAFNCSHSLCQCLKSVSNLNMELFFNILIC